MSLTKTNYIKANKTKTNQESYFRQIKEITVIPTSTKKDIEKNELLHEGIRINTNIPLNELHYWGQQTH